MAETDRNPRWALILSYLPLLGVFPLFFGRPSREVRWHARNGLFLFGGTVALGAVATAATLLFPSLSCVYGLGVFFACAVYAILAVLAMVKALQGERLIFPGLSRYADRG
ncbi:MAG: hypothetical protein M3R62_12845 [Acidobacteriota bacterium]|nr:hypothetical protein [Acidobacteriota bacterium]